MKIEELKSLIDEHTGEDGIDNDSLNKAINARFDALIDVKVKKAKASAETENIASFIESQGFENIDQFNAFVKNSKATSTELTEKVTRFETELEALRNENGQLKSANEEHTYLSKLSGVDDKYKKFLYSEIKGLVNEETDFDTARDSYLKDNPHYLKDNSQIVTKIPQNSDTANKTDGVTAILEKKHGIKLE